MRGVRDRPPAEQRDGGDRDDEAERHRPDQQRPKLGVLAAPDHEDVVEILGLQLRRHQREVHQRGHQREPGRAMAGRRIIRDQGEQRDHAELRERRRRRGVDEGDGARAEAEHRLGPLMQAVDQRRCWAATASCPRPRSRTASWSRNIRSIAWLNIHITAIDRIAPVWRSVP